MADFEVAVEKLLKIEGGLDDPSPGRDGNDETNFGIDEHYFPGLEVENLTREQAEDLYYKKYWTPMRLFLLNDQAIAEQILDAGVNCGQGTGIMLAQRAFNDLYPADPLKVDGVMGPHTVMAINEQKYPHAYRNVLVYRRVWHYLEVLAIHPEKESNRVGWMNRI